MFGYSQLSENINILRPTLKVKYILKSFTFTTIYITLKYVIFMTSTLLK